MNRCALWPIAKPIKINGPSNPIGRDAAPAKITLTALQQAVNKSVQVGNIIPFILCDKNIVEI